MENVKVCNRCNEEKSINDFGNDKRMKDGKKGACKKCTNEYQTNYLNENPDQRQKLSDYQKNNLETILKKRKENEEYLNYQREYQATLRKNKSYLRANTLRSAVRRYITDGENKHRKTKLNALIISMVGCTHEALKSYLQATAISNGYTDFDINNYDTRKYQIDHIIPCSKFDLTKDDQVMKCFNWKNMQVLTVRENVIKGNTSYADTLTELDSILDICIS